MSEIKTKIPAEMEPAAVGGMVTDAKYIIDRVKNKNQTEVNADTEERVSTLEESVGTGGSVDERIAVEKNRAEQAEGVLDGKIATEKQRAEGVEGGLNTRLQTVEELATISVGGGDIGIGTAADFESDDPSDLAKVPTVGAMLGGANDGVYDISARHSGATYADLAAALGTDGANVPVGVRKGGMSVKFVQSSDNKYVQARLMAQNFTTDVTQWQRVDDEPTTGSDNLVKSGGVYPLEIVNKNIDSYPLNVNNVEWNAAWSKRFLNIAANSIIRFCISENTAIYDKSEYTGKKIQLTFFKNEAVVQRVVVELGEEIIFRLLQDADSYGVYIYKTDTYGYYDIFLGVNEASAVLAYNTNAEFNDFTKVNKCSVGKNISYNIDTSFSETYSASNKIPCNITQGDLVSVLIENIDGIVSASGCKIDLYKNGTRIKREDITIGTEKVFYSSVDADEIGFYLYQTAADGSVRITLSINDFVLENIQNIEGKLVNNNDSVYSIITSWPETLSANNKRPFDVKIGDIISVFIKNINGLVQDRNASFADFYKNGTRVKRYPISFDTKNIIVSDVEADEIGFYLYETTVGSAQAIVGINNYIDVKIQELENDVKTPDYNNELFVYAARKRMLTYSEQTEMGLTPSQFINNVSSFLQVAHFSDVHGDIDRIKRIVAFANKADIPLIDSGDTVAGDGRESTEVYQSYIGTLKSYFLHAVGNHDSWGFTTDEQEYDKFIEPYYEKNEWQLPNTENPTYYYCDDANFKVRYIVLNQWAKYNAVSYGNSYYGQTQINWLITTLSSVPAGYGIIIVMHSPEESLEIDNNYSKFFQKVVYNGRGNTGSGITPVKDIIDAFISKTTLVKEIVGDVETININADFSNVASNEFICYITGHTHQDSVCYLTNTNNMQLMLNITTANVNCSLADNGLAELSDLGKVAGTISQDSFNVYTFDREHKIVKIVRIGADLPFDFSEKRDYMVIPYT